MATFATTMIQGMPVMSGSMPFGAFQGIPSGSDIIAVLTEPPM